MKQIKIILVFIVLVTILFGLALQVQALSAFVMPTFEILRHHVLEVVVVLMILMAIRVVSAGPGLRSR